MLKPYMTNSVIRIICRAVIEYEKSGIYTKDNLFNCAQKAYFNDGRLEAAFAICDLDGCKIGEKDESLEDFACHRLYEYLFNERMVEHLPGMDN